MLYIINFLFLIIEIMTEENIIYYMIDVSKLRVKVLEEVVMVLITGIRIGIHGDPSKMKNLKIVVDLRRDANVKKVVSLEVKSYICTIIKREVEIIYI